jgi:hypothetical protein
MPDAAILGQMLERVPGAAAYCCQCKWLGVPTAPGKGEGGSSGSGDAVVASALEAVGGGRGSGAGGGVLVRLSTVSRTSEFAATRGVGTWVCGGH